MQKHTQKRRYKVEFYSWRPAKVVWMLPQVAMRMNVRGQRMRRFRVYKLGPTVEVSD